MTATDQLAPFRDRFYIPKQADGSAAIYLCGHSLGLQPKSARSFVEQEMQDWERLGVEGHFHAANPWMPYHELLTVSTSRLVGAKADEVVVMNSLTVNLHLMMTTFYRPTDQRHKILIEANAFPSDRYAVASQLRLHGYDPSDSLIELSPRAGETFVRTEDIEERIEAEGERVALILFGGVNYYNGQAFDFARITRAGQAKGCIVGFDMAHAAGNLRLRLNEWGVDFAVWCSYKYLNAGPGAIAGCYVNERHARNTELPRVAGWWGHDKESRFRMGPDFQAIPSAEGWQLSNPSILSLATLRASMDIFDEAGMERLREKSERLTGYLEFLLKQDSSKSFGIITPGDPAQRGAQLSLRIPRDGKRVCDRLAKAGVICDWREPDIMRVAPVPLYNSFLDAYTFAEQLFEAL
ncbi:MAG TPA: kynureninase [Candidatus Acidoferrales bacterium]